MTAINSLLNSALSAMSAATQSLAVASNNLANEATPGYARQRLVVQPALNEGDRFRTGHGVEVVRIEALRDALIEGRLRAEFSNSAGEDVLRGALQDIEILFNDLGNTGMLEPITAFFNAFHELAVDPTSPNLRDQVRAAAETLIQAFRLRGDELRRIQNLSDQTIADEVHTVNSLAAQIADVSGEIQSQEAGGQMAHDLRTRRGELVKELSKYMSVSEVAGGPDYKLAVAGAFLVFDGQTAPVTAASSGPGGSVRLKIGSIDVSDDLTSGRIYAHQQVRDQFVPNYIARLDQLAYEIGAQVNAIHAAAYDRDGNTGLDFFSPLASATDAARQINLSAVISADPNRIATAKASAGTDNGAATEIGNLIHAPVFTEGSVVDQYRSLVFAVANDTTSASRRLDQSDAMLHQLENQRDAISGVSVDEETAKILQFQRAYQASASLIRIVDELLQVVLSMGSR